MSESAAATAATATTVGIAHDPLFINTPHGAVAVYGHELVSKKDIVILAHCLTLPEFGVEEGDHGVRMVMFREDNRPVDEDGPLMAACIPDAQSVVLNLVQIFTKAAEEAMDDPEVAIRACYHRNLIINYLHEIHHMGLLHKTGMPDDPDRKAELESLAEKWSLDKLYELAKSVDIEPSHHAESSFLAEQLMALLVETDDEWAVSQRHMLENNIMYHLPETGSTPELTFMSFKAVCHLMSGDEPESEEWTAETLLDVGQESELANAIRSIDVDAQEPVELPPTEATPNPTTTESPFVQDDAEDAQIPDPGVETVEVDPNMMDFGMSMGMDMDYDEPVESVAPAGAPGTPFVMNGQVVGQNVAPTNTLFPVAGDAAAPVAPAAAPAPTYAAATQTQPQTVTLPQTGYTPEQTRDIVFSVFNKIYNHIFTNCGRVLNSDMGFSNHDAVTTMPIALSAEEQNVVVKVDCLDENGRWCPGVATSNGQIRGYLSKGKLPFYKLYVNNNGQETTRLLMPQNPAKRGQDGQYSKPALQARGGSCIMYVKDVNADKFVFKCIDGAWQAC